MGWVSVLRGSVIGLDTTPLIYYFEENPDYIRLVEPFFDAVEHDELTIVTSTMTLLEVLVRPLQRGNTRLIQRYRDFLFKTQGVNTISLDPKIAEEAAHLRSRYNIRTPDSIHMATAIVERASFFLTNDMRLPSLPHLKVLTLDEIKTRPEYLQ